MRLKGYGTIFIILALLFISIGDRLLPQPFSTYSWNTRTQMNDLLLGLFPRKKIERPSQKREDAMQQFEHRVDPSSQ